MKSKYKWIFFVTLPVDAIVFAQEKTVTGVVSDAGGPTPGVNVLSGTNQFKLILMGSTLLRSKLVKLNVFIHWYERGQSPLVQQTL
jgi:hypothetical protein